MKQLTPHALRELLLTALGTLLGIGTVTYLSVSLGLPLLMASFGASAVLLYGVPDAPMARPRNVLGGHFLSALTGVSCYQLLGETWYAMTLAVTLAILVMLLTGTTHPPGGATALVCVLEHAGFGFILLPVLTGAAILTIWARLINHLRQSETEAEPPLQELSSSR